MPDESLFYGYCHNLVYTCTWDAQTNRIGYIDQQTYINKMSGVTMVAAVGLDDTMLGTSASESNEDPLIGCKTNSLLFSYFLLL